jgi:hypothetical protein
MPKISQRDAKMVLRSLGTSGQPPRWGARLINVGTDQFLRDLHLEYLEDHCAPFEGMDGGGACKWVEADYGNGKTQFLRCVQEMSWDLDYLTAYVELSQHECPLDRTDRVYGAVARAIQARPIEVSDVDRSKGLDVALSQLLDRKFAGVLTGMPDESQRQQAHLWVESLADTPVESTAFRTAVVQYLTALLDGNSENAKIAGTYLRGENIPAAELRKIGVYERLDQANGFLMLRSLCQLVQRSGLATGVVLLFDEARRTLSLMSTRARQVACENLLSVINKCNNGDLPGTLFLYAVMPEFFTNFATHYPALQQRCGPATRVPLNHLKGIKETDLLHQIGSKITEIFRAAYEDFPPEEERLTKTLDLVADAVVRDTMGSGTRRLLVKCWVQLLNDIRSNGIRELTKDDVESLIAGASEDLSASEVAEVEAEGE